MRKAAVFAFALALLGAASAQAPFATPFLTNLLDGRAQLTEEQAKAVVGGWNMTSSLRLDGPKVDKELLAFIAGRSDNNLTAAEALEKSLISSSVLGFRWIPAVDPKTGMFSSYTIIIKAGKVLDVQRLMGAALGQPDGSVLLTLTNSEDTGTATSIVKGDKMVTLWMEGLEVVQHNVTSYQEGVTASQYSDEPYVVDNQAVAVYEYAKLPESELERVETQVAEMLKKYWQADHA